MVRKLTSWFLKNLFLGAVPLISELFARWAAYPKQNEFASEKNIPELMFLIAMMNLGTADDIERASDVLDETKEAEKALKESLSNWHNLMMGGMIFASVFFGGYLFLDMVGTSNKDFLPRILSGAWVVAASFLVLALIAEVFINRAKHAPKTGSP